MTDGMSFEIEGLEALQARLSSLASGLRGTISRNALKAGALPIQNAAKAKAPVLSGTLRRSLHTEAGKEGDDFTARVGTDVPYARRIEYGFHDTDSLGRTYHQPAQPYMRPAFDEEKDNAQSEAIAVLKAFLDGAGA